MKDHDEKLKQVEIHVEAPIYCENCEDEESCDRCVMKEVLQELGLEYPIQAGSCLQMDCVMHTDRGAAVVVFFVVLGGNWAQILNLFSYSLERFNNNNDKLFLNHIQKPLNVHEI